MGKVKRRPRRKLIKFMSLEKPITLEQLGTQDDPCFGKHYDPRTAECSRCGDSELCAIALGQLNKASRSKIEKKSRFKDLEELEIQSTKSPKEIRKEIKARVYELVRGAGKKGINKKEVIDDLFRVYMKDSYDQVKLGKILKKIVSKSIKISENKKSLLWYSNKS